MKHRKFMKAWQEVRAEPEVDFVDSAMPAVSSMKPGLSAGFDAAVEATENTTKEINKRMSNAGPTTRVRN